MADLHEASWQHAQAEAAKETTHLLREASLSSERNMIARALESNMRLRLESTQRVPSSAIPPSGDDTVQVVMLAKRLSPGMEYGRYADLRFSSFLAKAAKVKGREDRQESRR